MGADLYITSVHQQYQDKYQPLFEKAVQIRNLLKKDDFTGFDVARVNEILDKMVTNDSDLRDALADFSYLYNEKYRIEEIPREQVAEAMQRIVEKLYNKIYDNPGYFRDSYNMTNVLATCGLSWWKDVLPMLDNEAQLWPGMVLKLKRMIERRPQLLPTEEQLREGYAALDEEHTVETWSKYFIDKRQKLLAFLQRAINLNKPIDCSL